MTKDLNRIIGGLIVIFHEVKDVNQAKTKKYLLYLLLSIPFKMIGSLVTDRNHLTSSREELEPLICSAA